MKEKIQLLAAALALILLLCGCAARGTASNDAKPAAGDVTDSNAAPYEVPAFRDSVFNEDEATAFGSGEIDLSQLEGGIIGVKAQSDTRLKCRLSAARINITMTCRTTALRHFYRSIWETAHTRSA